MTYILSNIYKWTLTLLTAESSSARYFMRLAGLLCPDFDSAKNHESAYNL